MSVGDWQAGTVIIPDRTFLIDVHAGKANVVEQNYWVVLPISGRQIWNGGGSGGFQYTATGVIPAGLTALADAINAGGMQVMQALAKEEGVPIQLAQGQLFPDGKFVPTPPPPP